MKLEAVIFDLDGTLIDSMGIWTDVDKEFLSKRNIPIPKGLFDDLKGGNSFEEVAKYFKNKFNLEESPEEIMQEWTEMVGEHYEKSVPLKSGVTELLEYLQKNKIKMGIGTSNSEFLTKAVIKSNKVSDYFKSIVVGKDNIKGKPFPDIFLKVAENLEVDPNNCLVIEDVLAGVLAAKNAGMKVFAIYDKYSLNESQLIKKEADFYAYNYDDILKKVKNASF